MAKPAPSRVAAALNYLERLKSQAAEFGGGVVENLADRARSVGGLAYEALATDPNMGRMTTAEFSEAASRPTPRLDQTAQDFGTISKAIVTQPIQTGKAIVQGEIDRAQEATTSPRAAGEYAGSFIDPMRIAAALRKGGTMRRDIFIGKSARTWDASAAKRAEELEAAGVEPENIWRETGTFRGPDGQLRQEIPDEMAFKPKFGLEGGESLAYDVNEAVFHPAMRKAYPNIMEETLTTVRYKPDAPEAGYYSPRLPAEGGYVGRDPEIMVSGKNRDEMKSVMAHELQHAVQQKEGFSRGGNPNQFPVMSKDVRESTIDWVRNKIANVAAKKYKDAEFVFSGMERGKPETFADPEINALMKKLKSLEISADPREQYKRLAGEAEARATQARRGMTMEQRRATFPYKSYDVPINELIK